MMAIEGVATGWTVVDMLTPLLPEGLPGIDVDPVSFFSRRSWTTPGAPPPDSL